MIRAVIIDDEKLARDVIFNYLKEYCPDVEVVAQAATVQTAYEAIIKTAPDLIFLDIEMPDGKGFDLLKMFDKINFRIIFVTAYSEYAIKAFRFSALDYLLKPVKIDELIEAVAKIRDTEQHGISSEIVKTLLNNLRSSSPRQSTLIIPNIKGFDVLKLNEIIMCQADGYCTNFYLTNDRKVVSSKNLKHFTGLLEDQNFLRVHHSYLVNLDHVTGYSRQGEILLSENLKAYAGDSYKGNFIKKFSGR
ncbi:MAG: response regulator transcription factor [Bacteroidales bacterium]|jgi:two-component system LytT family response regulator|nr:response regulator transcription factor [Bacteroidales bacterium]MCB1223748.1 response regulator transcription factor [Mesotoga sp.]MCB9029398.1 response regulator transcription factor [Bacteroidales bacterium]NLD62439.1 response regulator transcription factor [Bacteroidales bacterium]HNT93932.1 LytTR family DNA-binding domain-containing protein [Bacteroidales bacterium]